MDDTAALDAYLFQRHDRPIMEPPPRRGARDRGRGIELVARDGVPLAGSLFEPPASSPERALADARLPVVIASATGVKRRYYDRFAGWLAAAGHRVVTFDYRGIGGSRARGAAWHGADMRTWGEQDLAGVLASVGDRHGGGRALVVGHSVGGQLLGLLPEPERVAAVVSVASGSGDYRLWPASARWQMALLWYGVIPSVTRLVGYLPGRLGIGEDLPPGVALEWARWCRTPGYLVGGPGDFRRAGFARLRAPMLAFGFDDDHYAPPEAVDALLSLYTAAPVVRRRVARAHGRVGHFGFFRERQRALWEEARAFLEAAGRSAR